MNMRTQNIENYFQCSAQSLEKLSIAYQTKTNKFCGRN
jgi:hypothetical protein